ncbi:MAG: UvrD-helicase domain-containing protein [Phycisphaerae bacterium]|nr:UvrD-helicase domain-containing protein [Phycisphaerae bacterium]
MKLTPLQQAAVAAPAGDALVSASAGTGKTSVLSQRVLHLLCDARPTTALDRMLIVTFTRAAAAELRERIAEMIARRIEALSGRGDAASAALRRSLRAQEALLDKAEIGTIDSWCFRVLREHFAAAGVDPASRILPPADAAILRRDERQRLNDWLHVADDPLAVAAREWIDALPRPTEEPLGDLVEQLSRFREQLPDPAAWTAAVLAKSGFGSNGAERVTLIQAEARAILRDALATTLREQAEGLADHPDFSEYVSQLREWLTALERGDGLKIVAQSIGATKPGGLGPSPGPSRRLFDRLFQRRLREAFAEEEIDRILQYAPGAARRLETLIRLTDRYDEALRRAKQRRAAWEFGDVLQLTYRLLTTANSPVAAALRERYEHVLVDEYQDTSRLQAELFRAIARKSPGNRFLVGDVKQSIYGFRRADPAGFASVAAELAQSPERGRVYPLTDSFRTHADLLAPLNRLFATLFHPTFGGLEYDTSHHLTSGLSPLPNPTLDVSPRVAIHVLPERGQRDDDEEAETEDAELERIELEARVAAERIRALLASGAMVRDRDASGAAALRPLETGDVAILLRSAHVQAAQVAGMLRAEGLAAVAGAGDHLMRCLEVRDVVAALRLTLNRRDDLSLAAYLRGPLVGMDEAALLSIRSAFPHGAFVDAVSAFAETGPDGETRTLLRAGLRRIDEWRIANRARSASEMIRTIRADAGGDLFALAQPDGRNRLSQLEALSSFADETPQAGVSEFLERLTALSDSEQLKISPATEKSDAVRVLTIHAAKGLEWPAVFLLGAGASFDRRPQAGDLRLHETLGAALTTADVPTRAKWKHPLFDVIRRHQQHADREEELRIFYVAATRARERLEIIGHASADTWEAAVAAHGSNEPVRGVHPFLVESAASVMEWVRLAVEAGALRDSAKRLIELSVRTDFARSPQQAAIGSPGEAPPENAPAAISVEQRAAAEAQWRAIEAAESYRNHARPAAVSVSALKSRTHAERAIDGPARRLVEEQRRSQILQEFLARPAFMSPMTADESPSTAARRARPDGRDVGNAHHRFLRLCDLRRIQSRASIEEQAAQFLREGRLSPAEAELIDPEALAWLGETEIGRRLADEAEAVSREMPFVFALPVGANESDRAATLLRGVIDCLIVGPGGLTIIDYKTDRFRSPEDRAARIASYSTQLQLYAAAAEVVFGAKVVARVLVFLMERLCVDVAPSTPDWESFALNDGGNAEGNGEVS